jgi:hypothetical protein
MTATKAQGQPSLGFQLYAQNLRPRSISNPAAHPGISQRAQNRKQQKHDRVSVYRGPNRPRPACHNDVALLGVAKLSLKHGNFPRSSSKFAVLFGHVATVGSKLDKDLLPFDRHVLKPDFQSRPLRQNLHGSDASGWAIHAFGGKFGNGR